MNKMFLALACVSTLILGSCDKYNTIDNSATIKTPYSLLTGGTSGELFKSNNDKEFSQLFWSDGSFTHDILVADTNIIHVRNRIYVANGKSFPYSPVLKSNSTLVNDYVSLGLNDLGYKRVNTVLYDDARKHVYVCTKTGIELGLNNGATFSADPAKGALNIATSIVKLDNGNIYAYDNTVPGSGKFYERTPNSTLNVVNAFTAKTGPSNTGNPIWTLASNVNNLYAFCKFGYSKPKYSTDNGTTWLSTTGFADSTLLFMAKTCKFNGVLYAANEKGGLYKLVGTNFVQINGGLPPGIRIYDIVGKRNVYRTDATKDYYYLATDLGLYKSEDNANNWVKVRDVSCSSLD
jgi:hypothetical protein